MIHTIRELKLAFFYEHHDGNTGQGLCHRVDAADRVFLHREFALGRRASRRPRQSTIRPLRTTIVMAPGGVLDFVTPSKVRWSRSMRSVEKPPCSGVDRGRGWACRIAARKTNESILGMGAVYLVLVAWIGLASPVQ